jgi:virulence factor Mce-like protein
MRARWTRWTVLLVVLALFVTTACGNNDEIVLEATFDDTVELVPRHMVMTADVPIGTVADIELTDDFRSHITLRVQPGTGLPDEVRAMVRKTQVLGEYYVDIIPVSDSGELHEGSIVETGEVNDLETLIGEGTDLLAYLAADQISAAVYAGATTFGGRGSTFGSMLTNLEQWISRYGDRETEVIRLIDAFDDLLETITPERESATETLAALGRNSEAFRQESDRLLDALEDVRRLALVSERIMREHREESETFWRVFRQFLEQITRIDGALSGWLRTWPMHNLHTPNAIVGDHAQLVADLIVAHAVGDDPEGNDNSRTTTPDNPGDPSRRHPAWPGPDQCDRFHDGCEIPEGYDPPRTHRDGGPMWTDER